MSHSSSRGLLAGLTFIWSRARLGIVSAILILGAASQLATASDLPAGFDESVVATGFDPTSMTFAPDGRLFITEKPGRVRVIKDGAVVEKPFLDISKMVDNANERGLLSITFDPLFKDNGWVYVYYTRKEGSRLFNRLARYTALGDVATGDETVIFDMTDLKGPGNHNGGGVGFGADGKMYIATGEDANSKNSQDTGTLLGKLLRINKDGSIPKDNPKYNDPQFTGQLRAIVAIGVRNGFSIKIQPKTGLLYINDVGDIFDEIHQYNTATKPIFRNFGWSIIDGVRKPAFPAPEGYEDPVYAYDHGSGGGVAICGGDFYAPANANSGDAFPAKFAGMFFFSDYKGWIKYIDPANPKVRLDFSAKADRIIDAEFAPDGSLWYLARAGIGGGSVMDNTSTDRGAVWRIRWTGSGLAQGLGFEQQPNSAAAFTHFTTKVIVQDDKGLRVPSSSANVTLSLSTNPSGATLGGTTSATAIRGVATFDDLTLDKVASGYALTATTSDLKAGTSATFDVLAKTADPVMTPAGGSFTGPVWVQLHSAHPDATLFYTTDDSAPSAKSSKYTKPFKVSASSAVRAIAQVKGLSDSAVVASSFNIQGKAQFGVDYRPPVTGLTFPKTAAGNLPATLSSTGLFMSAKKLSPAPGLVPYTLNNTQWLDNADANRWLALSGAGQIGFNDKGEFTWPGNSVLVQHIEIGKTGGGKRRLETRVLVLDVSGTNAYGVTYKWRADGSDADLVPPEGAEEKLANVPGGQTWNYPARGLCMMCHTPVAGLVLGAKARQLNGDFKYPSGRTDNQLRTWNYLQMFTKSIDENSIANIVHTVSINDTSAPLEARVRSYLDTNCTGCHRPGGNGAMFDTRYDLPMEHQNLIYGRYRNGMGLTGAKIVLPKDLTKSILYLRMNTTDPAIAMPPLSRNLVDKTAVDLLAQWINLLPIEPAP